MTSGYEIRISQASDDFIATTSVKATRTFSPPSINKKQQGNENKVLEKNDNAVTNDRILR